MTLALLITAATGAWADEMKVTIDAADYDATSTYTSYSKEKDGITITFSSARKNTSAFDLQSGTTVTITSTVGKIKSVVFYCLASGTAKYGPGCLGSPTAGQYSYIDFIGTWTGEAETFTLTSSDKVRIEKIDFTVGESSAAPDVEVTTNAAEEGATFTEATFAMPTFDATAEYELVRDMGYKVAFSGVPTRARLAKDGDGKFHFADGLTFQLLDNIDAANPKDITSAEGITFMVGEVEAVDIEGSTFYQLDKETLVPLADFLADAHLGNYAICAVASTGEYDGSFTSGRIELFQGYEVTVPAGEYATFYKDEPLYADTETSADAVLYTVSSVSGTQAVLSSAITTAPSLTPLLVYNAGEQDKTFLLIPADAEPNEAVTVAPEFVGTLEATTIAASTSTKNNYALNGKQFVWVKNAISIAANKAYLSVTTGGQLHAPALSIVSGDSEATGIRVVSGSAADAATDWYDLNGRKLDKKPTQKGIYINNGRKVVVK